MGDLGVPELLIILAVVIVIFGPGKLADLGRVVGSSLRDFRRAVRTEQLEAREAQPDELRSEQPVAAQLGGATHND